jgi:hypothetical protein
MGTTQGVGVQRLAERIRLQEDGQARERALLRRRGRETRECRPERIFYVRRDLNLLLRPQGPQSIPPPRRVRRLIDSSERLKGDLTRAPKS